MTHHSSVQIYVDGGRLKELMGAWAAILTVHHHGQTLERILKGRSPEVKTTTQRMELTAAVEALKTLKRPCAVEIVTDAVHIYQGGTTWLAEWAANTGHSFTTQVAHLARDAGAGRLYLVHVDPRRADDDPIGIDRARDIFPETYLAHDRHTTDF